VFVANNVMSVGALQVLFERRLTPNIGLASFGDLPFPTLPHTQVTIIPLPARHLGVTAATLLIERINGDNQPARTIVLRNEVSPPKASVTA
jgi:LacI family transcriptional regulator